MSQNIVNFPGASLRAEDARFTTFYANNVSMHASSGLEQITSVGHVTTTGIEISNIKPSTSTTTGALVVSGGVGIAGNVNVGGNATITGNVTTVGQVITKGLEISQVKPSTSTTTGALVVNGGVGMSGNVNVGGNATITENVTVRGGTMELTQVANTFQIKSSSNVVTEYTRSKKLIKYPRVAMTANSSGGYVASASSYYNTGVQPYEAFEHVNGTLGWESGPNSVNGDGRYSSGSTFNTTYINDIPSLGEGGFQTTVGSTTYTGEWVQIQLPIAIRSTIHVFGNSDANSDWNLRIPQTGVILGSTNGSSWEMIHDFESTLKNATISTSHTEYYNYFRLVILSVGTDQTLANVPEWEILGVPEYDPDADGTDVIARSVPNVPNTDSLKLYYDAKNYSGSGAIQDETTNNRDADMNATFDNGEIKAFNFSGAYTSNVTTSDHGLGTGDVSYTMSFWFKRTAVASTYDYLVIMGNGGSNYQAIVMNIKSNLLRLDHWAAVTSFTEPIVLNKWYHVVAGHRGGKTPSFANDFLYIDGLRANVTVSGTEAALNLTGSKLTLGSSHYTTTEFLQGSIANFRLFNRALTEDEVWQLYAYQKEYFGHGNLGMTLTSGRLGIGTTEPRAVLDVRGSIQANGRPVWPVPTAQFYKASPGSAPQTYTENIVRTGRVDFDSTYFDTPGVIERYVYTNASNKTTEDSSSGGIIKFCLPGTYHVSSRICINKQSANTVGFGWRFYHLSDLGGNFRVGSRTDGIASYGGEQPDTGVISPTSYGKVWMVRVTEAPAYGYLWIQPSANSGTLFKFETYAYLPMAHMDIFYLG